MTRKNILWPALAALAYGSTASAEDAPSSPHHFTANLGVYSQYVFRGLTQTNEKAALQGGFDYANDNGFYVGTWLSNISWFSDTNGGTSNLEWDGYTGYRKTWANGVLTDIGYLRYQYPGDYPVLAPGTTKPNTDELYLGVGWKWATLKYSYSLGDTFGVEDARGTSYLDLTVSIPLAEGFALALHAGQQKFKGSNDYADSIGSSNDDLYTYEDYKAAVTYAFGGTWTAAAAYTHTNAKDAGYTVLGDNLGDDQVIVSLSRAF
jgi:uncharacterized protein (TIGR02001 family)